MQRVLHGRLDRLVVLGERSVEHGAREEPAGPLAVHDERPPRRWILWVHRGGIVGHVALPLLVGHVPRDAGTRRIPRLAFGIGGGSVVHDAAVEGPAPRPPVIETHAGGVVLLRILDARAALAQVAGFGLRAGIDPLAGGGGAVLLPLPEAIAPLA